MVNLGTENLEIAGDATTINADSPSGVFFNFKESTLDANNSVAKKLFLCGTYESTATTLFDDFYSLAIFARSSDSKSWFIGNYKNSELSISKTGDYYGVFDIKYFDGSTILERLRLDNLTGTLSTITNETRNGNRVGTSKVQQTFGYNENRNIQSAAYARHNIRTQHSYSNDEQNSINFYVWGTTDLDTSYTSTNLNNQNILGSTNVFSLLGSNSAKINNGTLRIGESNKDIDLSGSKIFDTETLNNETALLGKSKEGVIYYNKSISKFRYSENGGAFKSFDASADAKFLESSPLQMCSGYNMDTSFYAQTDRYTLGTTFLIQGTHHLKSIYVSLDFSTYSPSVIDKLSVAIYSNPVKNSSDATGAYANGILAGSNYVLKQIKSTTIDIVEANQPILRYIQIPVDSAINDIVYVVIGSLGTASVYNMNIMSTINYSNSVAVNQTKASLSTLQTGLITTDNVFASAVKISTGGVIGYTNAVNSDGYYTTIINESPTVDSVNIVPYVRLEFA